MLAPMGQEPAPGALAGRDHVALPVVRHFMGGGVRRRLFAQPTVGIQPALGCQNYFGSLRQHIGDGNTTDLNAVENNG